MGVCGSRQPIIRAIRFPVRRRKHWYWRQNAASDSGQNGGRNYDLEPHLQQIKERVDAQQKAVQRAMERLDEAREQVQDQQTQVDDLEKQYQTRRREERPTSQLAKARQRFQMLACRLNCRETARLSTDQRLAKTQVQVAAHVSAKVIRNSEGRLLRFSSNSAFAGKVLQLPAVHL